MRIRRDEARSAIACFTRLDAHLGHPLTENFWMIHENFGEVKIEEYYRPHGLPLSPITAVYGSFLM